MRAPHSAIIPITVFCSMVLCHCENEAQCECIPVSASSSSNILFGPVCRSYSWGCVDDPQTGWATDDVEGWYTKISIDEETGCPYISSGCSSSHNRLDAAQIYQDSAAQEDTPQHAEDGSFDSGSEDAISRVEDGSRDAGDSDSVDGILDSTTE